MTNTTPKNIQEISIKSGQRFIEVIKDLAEVGQELAAVGIKMEYSNENVHCTFGIMSPSGKLPVQPVGLKPLDPELFKQSSLSTGITAEQAADIVQPVDGNLTLSKATKITAKQTAERNHNYVDDTTRCLNRSFHQKNRPSSEDR